MRLSYDQSAARSVGRNSERFRHRTSQATAFGGTALRSVLRASLLALGGLLLGLTGCVSTISTSGADSTTGTVANSGTVVVSMGSRNPFAVLSHRLQVRDVTTGASTEIIYLESNIFAPTPRIVNTKEMNVGVLSLNFPEGEYVIHDVVTNFAGYPSGYSISGKSEFSIPFSVRRGQVTYLGQYLAHRVTGKNVFGKDVTAGIYFVVTDEQSRDIAIASTRILPTRREIVTKQIVDAAKTRSPLIRNE